MPVYSFRCRKCGREYDAFVQRYDQPAACPACGDAKPERLLTLVGRLLKSFGRRAGGAHGCAPRGRSGFG
ncbi:MAG: zinc ribbon domain-containing protein [Planctomycetota bacterium]